MEHVIARLKDWQLLRQCWRRGNATKHGLQVSSPETGTSRPAPNTGHPLSTRPVGPSALVRARFSRPRARTWPAIAESKAPWSTTLSETVWSSAKNKETVVMRPVTGDRTWADVGVTESLDQPHAGGAGPEFTFSQTTDIRLEHCDSVHERLRHRHVEIVHDQNQLLGVCRDAGPLQRRGHVVTDALSGVLLRNRTAVGECAARDVNRLGTGILRAGQRTAGRSPPVAAEQLS